MVTDFTVDCNCTIIGFVSGGLRLASRKLSSYIASGAVVCVAAGFLAFIVKETREGHGSGISLIGYFSSSNGLPTNAPVEVGGVTVGHVVSVGLDLKSFSSRVVFTVNRKVCLPDDSSLALQSGGTSSSAVLTLSRGKSLTCLLAGSVVRHTVPAGSLEHDIGDYIFGNGGLADTN